MKFIRFIKNAINNKADLDGVVNAAGMHCLRWLGDILGFKGLMNPSRGHSCRSELKSETAVRALTP